MINILFDKCICKYIHFNNGTLSMGNFLNANLRYSTFINTKFIQSNFYLSNLAETDLTNSTITENDLENALSIQNAILPNRTIGKYSNLIKNGNPDCNIPLNHHWNIDFGYITITNSNQNPSQCYFYLESISTSAIIYQIININNILDYSFWNNSYLQFKRRFI